MGGYIYGRMFSAEDDIVGQISRDLAKLGIVK